MKKRTPEPEKGRRINVHKLYPLRHTLVERNMGKGGIRFAAGLTTNRIANMGKENTGMETPIRICEALNSGILDVIELEEEQGNDTAN